MPCTLQVEWSLMTVVYMLAAPVEICVLMALTVIQVSQSNLQPPIMPAVEC